MTLSCIPAFCTLILHCRYVSQYRLVGPVLCGLLFSSVASFVWHRTEMTTFTPTTTTDTVKPITDSFVSKPNVNVSSTGSSGQIAAGSCTPSAGMIMIAVKLRDFRHNRVLRLHTQRLCSLLTRTRVMA